MSKFTPKGGENIVEYAMNRSLSPTMVAEYKLQLIDKSLLEQKLREYKDLIIKGGTVEKLPHQRNRTNKLL